MLLNQLISVNVLIGLPLVQILMKDGILEIVMELLLPVFVVEPPIQIFMYYKQNMETNCFLKTQLN